MQCAQSITNLYSHILEVHKKGEVSTTLTEQIILVVHDMT